MNIQTEISLSPAAWAAIGAVSLAPVGAMFGAAAGAVARASGRTPGGAPGRAVLNFFARAWRTEFSPPAAGAIAGAADGALFLCCVGVVVGLVAGYGGAKPNGTIILVSAVAALLLALAAL